MTSLLLPAEFAYVCAIVLRGLERRERLRAMRACAPRDAWLSAGFVRNAVFDQLFGPARVQTNPDLDVIYLDASDSRAERDRGLERELHARSPGPWSVKNQVRMAVRNGNPRYSDVEAALRHFPETATAVAVRLHEGSLQLLAPYGLTDLCSGVIRATPRIRAEVFALRCVEKRWNERWPGVRVVV